jgi:hypothetical protein
VWLAVLGRLVRTGVVSVVTVSTVFESEVTGL